MGHALFRTRFGPLDVLAFIEEIKTYEDLLGHTIEIEFRGHTIQVLDITISQARFNPLGARGYMDTSG